MEKLSFKQYLASKAQLLEAVQQTPCQTLEYSVRKYCKMPLGETKDSKEYVALKPKQTIIVEWLYITVDNPVPVSIKFSHLEEEQYETFWSGEKLQNWLTRNARQLLC